MQMKHSSLTIQEAAETPMPGKSLEDLDMHIAAHLAAGWIMAQYAVHVTSTGIRHHFIWQGPDGGSPFPEGMDPRAPGATDDGSTARV